MAWSSVIDSRPQVPGSASRGAKAPSRGPRTSLIRATAGQKAYEAIRALILEGGLAPGQWLKEEELTAICGASRTPVREAIRRLSAEGLVVKAPRHGAQVATISQADLKEIYALRSMLESHAARRAAQRITPEQIRRLEALAGVMEDAERSGPEAVWTRFTPANSEFHNIILEASHSPRLVAMAAIVVQLPLTLRTLSRYTEADRERSHRHHRELIAAFRAQNADWAGAVMQSHVEAALEALLRGAAAARAADVA